MKSVTMVTFAIKVMSLSMLGGTAHADKRALGGRLSSQGVGLVFTQAVVPNLNMRLGGYLFRLDYRSRKDGNEFDFDLTLQQFNGLLDWHPFGGKFRLSGGAVYNGNKLEAVAVPSPTYDVGGRTFTHEQVGTLTGDLDFRRLAPYVGIGWGNAISSDGNWSVAVDLGVIFQGRPRVTLTSAGGLFSETEFLRQALAEEERDIEQDIDFFRYFPVLSIGLNYRF